LWLYRRDHRNRPSGPFGLHNIKKRAGSQKTSSFAHFYCSLSKKLHVVKRKSKNIKEKLLYKDIMLKKYGKRPQDKYGGFFNHCFSVKINW